MRKIIIALSLLLYLNSAWCMQNQLVAVFPETFPPEYQLVDGKPEGFAIDIASLLLADENIGLELKAVTSWAKVHEMMVSGKADMIPMLGVTDKRAQNFIFTKPIYTISVSIFTRKGRKDISGLDDLKNKSVGTGTTNIAIDILKKNNIKNVIVFNTVEEMIFALLASKVDAIVYPNLVVQAYASNAGIKQRIVEIEKPLVEVKRALAFDKQHNALVDRLNQKIEKFVDSNKYAEIYQRWYGKQDLADQIHGELYNYIYVLSAIVFVLLLFIVFYLIRSNSILTGRVNQKTRELSRENEQNISTLKSLYDTNLKYDSMLNALLQSVIIINSKGIMVDINEAVVELFGYSEEELLGKNVSMLMPQADAIHHDEYLERYLKNAEKNIVGITREVTVKRKDGVEVPCHLSVSEFKQHNEIYFTGVLRDISDLKAKEIQLQKEKEIATQANNAKSIFLSSMSHELRTPLNAIIGFSQILELDVEDPRKLSCINEIKSASNHLLRLILDILDLSVVDSNKEKYILDSYNLSSIIESSIQLCESTAKKKGVTINYTRAEEEIFVYVDETRARQIFINVISNAIKYNNEYGFVTVDFIPKQHYVLIEVIDTGIGIPESQRDNVFTAFERLGQEQSKIEGTGIGLALSKKLVHKMGGDIGFKPNKRKGTTFWVTLPISSEKKVRHAMPKEIRIAENRLESIDTQFVILCVEDIQVNQRLIESILSKFKTIKLHMLDSGEECVKRISEISPDLILMDLNLPGMSSVETLSRIKTYNEFSEIPAIAISANAHPADIDNALKEGFDAYVTKPINIVNLMNVIENLLLKSA